MDTSRKLKDQSSYIKDKVADIAKRQGVVPELLWEMYCTITECNFEQDLWDIANENFSELRKGE